MAIGERIRFFRNRRGMTMKYLGSLLGFPENSADVRVAQYEAGTRTPKAEITAQLANALDVCPAALTVPDIDSNLGLMHTLFTLEDTRGLKIGEIDGELCLRLDKSAGTTYVEMLELLSAWLSEAKKLEAGEITRKEYDRWRYFYPQYDTAQRWAKVPSQGLSDLLIEGLKSDQDE